MNATNVRAKKVVVHSRRRKNPVLHRKNLRGRLLDNENQPTPKRHNCHTLAFLVQAPQLSPLIGELLLERSREKY
jgi:hypothetical protein